MLSDDFSRIIEHERCFLKLITTTVTLTLYHWNIDQKLLHETFLHQAGSYLLAFELKGNEGGAVTHLDETLKWNPSWDWSERIHEAVAPAEEMDSQCNQNCNLILKKQSIFVYFSTGLVFLVLPELTIQMYLSLDAYWSFESIRSPFLYVFIGYEDWVFIVCTRKPLGFVHYDSVWKGLQST